MLNQLYPYRVFMMPALAILFVGIQVPARASSIYVVATFAETSYGQGFSTAAYNNVNNFTNSGGSSFSSNSPFVTANGTTDNTGTALASIDQTTAPNNYGTAIADLSTGALKVVSASAADPNVGGGNRAIAEYLDTLHFSFAGAGPSTVTNIPFTLSLDGSIVAAAPSIGGDVQWSVNVGGATLFTFIQDQSSGSGSCPTAYVACIGQQTSAGWINPTFISDTPSNIIFSGVIALTGANPSLTVSNFLSSSNTLGPASFDFSHTSLLSFTLPGGGSYTSDSGVFDTVPSTSSTVPEPASFYLIGLGLLCAGGLGRWKRKA